MACFFDIETTGLHDRALVTCAATMTGTETIKWHSDFEATMTRDDIIEMIDYLCLQDYDTSFNGANFDFKILYFVTGDGRVLKLAEAHTDICLSFGAEKGYFTSLNSFMLGCNIPGKNGSGADAITAWLNGSKAEKKSILDYCVNDVRCLRDLYKKMKLQPKRIFRQTKGGRRQRWHPRLESVAMALERYRMKPPDTSWMTKPPKIDQVLSWFEEIPPYLIDESKQFCDEAIAEACGRSCRSKAEFEAAIAEEVYAAKIKVGEENGL